MARVEISEEAGRELRDRMAARHSKDGILIHPGPAHEEYRGPQWTEEEQIIAPSQRWLLLMIGLASFDDFPGQTDAVSVSEIDGFRVCVFLPPKKALLRVELVDGAIRVRETETDA